MDTPDDITAHAMKVTHSYLVHVPEHEPRENDPHHADFEEYKRRRKASNTWYCDYAKLYRNGDTSECDLTRPLECHHSHIEFCLQNGIDISLLEKDYPGISLMTVGAWIDSAANLELLCVRHHRGLAGKHLISVSDFEGGRYVRNLFGET